MPETFKAKVGQITISDETICLERMGEVFEWKAESFPHVDWWVGVPDVEPQLFAQVAEALITQKGSYLDHPVIRGWIRYNQQVIPYLRASAVPFSDERIRQAEDYLKAIGGSSLVKAAKQAVKKKDTILADRFDDLYKNARSLHELWWASRNKHRSPTERKRHVLENFDPSKDICIPDDVPYECYPSFDEEEVESWSVAWIQIFEDSLCCSERKRQDIHLRQAIRSYLEKDLPGVSLSNLRRGRKSKVG